MIRRRFFYDLVKFSAEQKADVNTIINNNITILHFVENPEVYKLLEENGAKCSVYAQKVMKLIETIGLSESNILEFPKELHKSLVASKRTYTEMPKIVNHVWLTSKSSPREINQDDLDNLLNTQKFFVTQMEGNWKQIIWVNDKNLIPYSVGFLEEHNIEVKVIEDFKANIRLFDQIEDLVVQGKLVMAADLLRYSVELFIGGVYADLNYRFKNEFNLEVKKYDFFVNSLVNSFFMSKPNHPILSNLVNFLEKYFNDDFENLLCIKDHGNVREQTMLTSAYTFAYNIVKYINKEDNIDFVNPRVSSNLNFDKFTCDVGVEAYFYADLMEFCSNPLTVTGEDWHSGW